jgi:hypothetical protein
VNGTCLIGQVERIQRDGTWAMAPDAFVSLRSRAMRFKANPGGRQLRGEEFILSRLAERFLSFVSRAMRIGLDDAWREGERHKTKGGMPVPKPCRAIHDRKWKAKYYAHDYSTGHIASELTSGTSGTTTGDQPRKIAIKMTMVAITPVAVVPILMKVLNCCSCAG